MNAIRSCFYKLFKSCKYHWWSISNGSGGDNEHFPTLISETFMQLVSVAWSIHFACLERDNRPRFKELLQLFLEFVSFWKKHFPETFGRFFAESNSDHKSNWQYYEFMLDDRRHKITIFNQLQSQNA